MCGPAGSCDRDGFIIPANSIKGVPINDTDKIKYLEDALPKEEITPSEKPKSYLSKISEYIKK